MAALLDSFARHLAASDAVSRRDLMLGRRGATKPDVPIHGESLSRLGDESAASARARHLPPPTADDIRAMRAVIAHVPPSPSELKALFDSLKQPRGDTRFNSDTFTKIARMRTRFARAHAAVAQINRHSALRANLLEFLADTDATLATLAQLGRTTNPARARRLAGQAAKLEKRAKALYQEIAPTLTQPPPALTRHSAADVQ
jgi:hypothetical protein